MQIFTKRLLTILLKVFTVLLQEIRSQSCSEKLENVEIICSKLSVMNLTYTPEVLVCYSELEMSSSINSTLPESSVSSVVHSNRSKVENLSEIEAIWIEKAIVKFIPKGINNFLPNLRVLYIGNSGLLSVKKENLKEFGNSLELLALHDRQSTHFHRCRSI